MRVEGTCHCKAIAYEAEIDPTTVGICHCGDCQMLTGSAFRVSVPAAAGAFRLRSGRPTVYVKTADSGTRRRHAFCGQCGAPVYATADSDAPPTYSLRVGCLAQRRELAPKRRIWCRSALPWSQDIASVPGIDGQ
jgi:hypothetical protein